MNLKGFEQKIEKVRQTAEALRQATPSGDLAPDQERLAQALEQLNVAMEELHVAQEELHVQADELEAAHQALEAERHRYRDLFEHAPDPYVVTDMNGVIRQANQAAARLLNVEAGFLAGKPMTVYMPDPEIPSFQRRLMQLRKTGQLEAWPTHVRPRDREPVEVEISAAPERDGAGEIKSLRWLIRDTSERTRVGDQERRLKEQLRGLAARLEAVREEERARIAHELHDEFGAMLSGLKMDLAWLERHLTNPPPAIEERLTAMMSDLDSIIQSARWIATELRPIMLEQLGVLAAIDWQCQEFAKHTGLTCRLQYGDDVEAAGLRDGQAIAVFRACQEALTNVARHARATEVEVGVRLEDDQFVLHVRDNGRGITLEQQAHAQSFGLMGMRERVRQVGGEVQITGAAGEGTTVAVRIPIA